MTEPEKRIQVILDVTTPSQAAELNAAWQEIIAGKRARLNTAAEDTNEIMERARVGLSRIVKAVDQNPGTGQGRRLVRFLAGVYNGNDYPFDLTDLRALDTELASACVDYLNYDRLAKAEVHTHLPGGGQQMQSILEDAGVQPTPRFSDSAAHESRLHALAERGNENVYDVLRRALEDFLSRSEERTFGSLLASIVSGDDDRPLLHARYLNETTLMPICGAQDGPWSDRGFDFARLSCWECRSMVLNPTISSEA
jgi:hypothetical protein